MFHFYKNKAYQLPVLFGSIDYDPTYEAICYDSTIVTFVQQTTADALADYLPAKFSLLEPTITYQFLQLREVNFLDGGAYNIFQVSLPVHFEGNTHHLDGFLPMVLWENNTIPILSGREFSGMPKIFADISDLSADNGNCFSAVSYQENTFLTFDIGNMSPASEEELVNLTNSYSNVNNIGIRYIPKVGGPGADLIQCILYPQAFVPYESYTGEGTLSWHNFPQGRGLMHGAIVEQLSALPNLSMSSPTLMKGKVIMKSPLCEVIY